MRNITYFGTDIVVQPGDIIRFRRWFHNVDGIIVYVPDISTPNKFFGVGEGADVGIQTVDGFYYGIFISEVGELKKTVLFRERGGNLPPLPDDLDDPIVAPDFCRPTSLKYKNRTND